MQTLGFIGLGVMGVGGLIAVVGGVLFLVVVAVVWQRGTTEPERESTPISDGARRYQWTKEIRTASIRSRS